MAQLGRVGTQKRAVIEVDGHHLVALVHNADKRGDAPTVVFMHGIGGSNNFWAAGQPDILRDRYWVSLSLPGHTPATFPAGFPADDIQAEPLARVMAVAVRKLTGGDPAVLVGHSTGGFMALNIAAHAPEVAAGVMSVAGFAHGYWTGMFRIAQQLSRFSTLTGWLLFAFTYDWLYRSPESQAEYFENNLAVDVAAMRSSAMYQETKHTLYADSLESNRDAIRMWFKQMPDVDITPQLGNITAPVLQLHGELDPIVPPAQGPHIIEHVPNGELVMLPGCGHMVPWERNADYQAALTRFLTDVVE